MPNQKEWGLANRHLPAEPAGKTVPPIDEQMTGGMQWPLKQEPFPLCDREVDLFSGGFMQLPVFDVVISTGVLDHVQDPLNAPERLRARTGEPAIMGPASTRRAATASR